MSEKVEKGRLKKYGKEYGKYAACVVTGFALYGAAEVNRKLGDPARNAVLERKRYGEGDRQYDLLVDGLGEREAEISVTIPERKMSADEMQEIAKLDGTKRYYHPSDSLEESYAQMPLHFQE